MKANEIVAIYATIKEYHEKYLESKGVKLPNLIHGGQFTKDALTLVYLCRNYPNTAIVINATTVAIIQILFFCIFTSLFIILVFFAKNIQLIITL